MSPLHLSLPLGAPSISPPPLCIPSSGHSLPHATPPLWAPPPPCPRPPPCAPLLWASPPSCHPSSGPALSCSQQMGVSYRSPAWDGGQGAGLPATHTSLFPASFFESVTGDYPSAHCVPRLSQSRAPRREHASASCRKGCQQGSATLGGQGSGGHPGSGWNLGRAASRGSQGSWGGGERPQQSLDFDSGPRTHQRPGRRRLHKP